MATEDIPMDITRRSVSTVLGRGNAIVHNNPKTPRKGRIGQRRIMIRHIRRQLAERIIKFINNNNNVFCNYVILYYLVHCII